MRAMLGERLRALREARRLTLEEAASHIGVTWSALAMYERGERQPSLRRLKALADFYRVSSDYLLDRPADPQADWARRLPPDLRDFVLQEAHRGFPYLRMARDASLNDLDPDALESIVKAWRDARRRAARASGPSGVASAPTSHAGGPVAPERPPDGAAPRGKKP